VLEYELAAIDAACSRFRNDSELARVNAADGGWVEVSALFAEAAAIALRAARLTDGIVDPTIGGAMEAAGYDRDFALVASGSRRAPPAIAPAPPSWRALEIDLDRGAVRVAPGVRLDFGATAKALAADRAAPAAADAVGCGVLVNLGGDISVAGPAPAGGWVVHVTDDHRTDASGRGQRITIASGGLATSSTTVRRWLRDGDAMHHIIDPATGAPAREVWRTVSVAAASCVDANTASTAAVVMGDDAVPWLSALGLPARLVRTDGSVVAVAGWPQERT
jgi:thiamine biosynthesis lipoprotein